MSSKGKISKVIATQKPFLLKKFSVVKIGIFGSYARGEETKKSDVDVLVEFKKPVGWEFVDLKEYLEKKLGKKVDLVTIKALKPQIKSAILREVQYL
jgi:uncharacterized protein